jgi:hypothetical protein
MRFRMAMAVVCSFGVVACGGIEGDRLDKTGSEADLITDTCSTSQFDSNVCAGVWQYPDRCCAVGYGAYNSCNHSRKFNDYSLTQFVTFPSGPCFRECDTIPGKCIWICDPGSPDCGPTEQTALNNVMAVYNSCTRDPNSVDGKTGLVSPWNTPALAGPSAFKYNNATSGWCTATVKYAPMSDSGAINSCPASPDWLCDGAPGTEQLGACQGPQPAVPAGGVPANGVNTGISNLDKTTEKQLKRDCPGLWRYSLPGQTLAQIPTIASPTDTGPGPDPLNLSPEWTATQPTCLTCDPKNSPLDPNNASAVQGKFDCITQSLASVPNAALGKDPDMKKKLVTHGQLLFEYYGDKLTPTQVTAAEGLYTGWQGVFPACSEPPDTALPAPNAAGCNPSAADATTKVVDGKLKMCDRLRDYHSGAAVAALEAGNCADAWNAVPASCSAKPDYATAYSEISTELLRKGFSFFPETDPTARQSKLRNWMSITERWYEDMKAAATARVQAALVPGPSARAQLMRDSEIVAGSIIKGAYANRLAGTTSLAATQRNTFVNDAMKDDQEMLGVLLPTPDPFTGKPPVAPLKNGPALWLLAHTLQPTQQRLAELDFMHDLGCDFRGCKPATVGGAPLATKLTQMRGSLGAIPAAGALSTAARTLLDLSWQTTFDNLAANHGPVFQSAVMDVMGVQPPNPYDPALVTGATEADGPVYAVAAIARDSKTKSDYYAVTGRLRPGDKEPLYTGLLSRKLDDTIAVVDRAKAALSDARTRFETNWLTLLSTSVQLVGGGDQLTNAQNELKTKGAVLKQYLEQIDGLRTAATVDLERFGDFTKSYDAYVKNLETTQTTTYINRAVSKVLSITPANARYDGSSKKVTDLAVLVPDAPFNGGAFKQSAAPGDLVRIEMIGNNTWSPTCAIAAYASKDKRPTGISGLIQAVVDKAPISPPLEGFVGAQTGPQGYGVVFSGSSYQAHGTTDPDFNVWNYFPGAGAAGGAVIGGSFGGPPGSVVGGLVGGEIGRIAGGIISGLFGGDTQSADTSGTEKRQTAVFNAGLRVPTAPYSGLPAGALLAVKVTQNTTNVIDIEVVQAPSTTLVIDQATDVYLVVNDAVCDRTVDPVTKLPVNLGGLAVQLTTLTPSAGFALQLQPAVTETYAYVQGQISKILPQGVVLPSDLSAIRSQAMSTLSTKCACDLTTNFDRSLMTFYSAFVDTALNQIERQVEIGRLERQVRILSMEFDSLAAHVMGLQRQSQVLSLLPAWAAKNIDEDQLRFQTRDLVSSVERYLHPFARAKYPEVLSGSTGFVGLQANPALFDPLTVRLDWNNDWGKIADDTISIVNSVESKFLEARLAFDKLDTTGKPVTETIGIAIPKPTALWTPDMIPGAYGHLYRELSPSASLAIWTAIRNGQQAEITISPDDLYRRFSEPAFAGQLDCTKMVPVIQSAAIYAADDGGSINPPLNDQSGHNVVTFSSDELMYGTADGPVPLLGGNIQSWLTFSTPILYGLESNAIQTYVTKPPTAPAATAGAGQGLSPFGKYTLSADTFHLDRPAVFALILLMTVEYRSNTNGATASWLTHCQ